VAPEGSLLLLDEYFASGDARFRSELLSVNAPKKLGPFAEKWIKDPRAWSRQMLRDFLLDRSFERPQFKPLVKRLFKLAEAAGDDRAMAWFMVAGDCSVRRSEAARARTTASGRR